jgi:hypothetical protein
VKHQVLEDFKRSVAAAIQQDRAVSGRGESVFVEFGKVFGGLAVERVRRGHQQKRVGLEHSEKRLKRALQGHRNVLHHLAGDDEIVAPLVTRIEAGHIEAGRLVVEGVGVNRIFRQAVQPERGDRSCRFRESISLPESQATPSQCRKFRGRGARPALAAERSTRTLRKCGLRGPVLRPAARTRRRKDYR